MHGKNCLSIGIALGMILGIVFDNLALGSLVGVCLGVATGSILILKNIKK